MFQAFRRFLVALDSIKSELRFVSIELSELCGTLKEQGPATERLEELERSRHQFEAMCEGLLLKAEGKLRAANNSEARERSLRKSYAQLLDPLPEDEREPETATRDSGSDDYAAASQAQGVQPVHLDVAPSNKTLAQRAKFGVK